MKKLFPFVFLLAVPFLPGCSEPASIPGFDSETWQQDKKGCQGNRFTMTAEFDAIRKELYGKPENEVKDILGKPDAEQLMSRGQRLFIYYLEAGSQCEKRNQLSNANRAEVRFNALNKVSEITYLRPIQTTKKIA